MTVNLLGFRITHRAMRADTRRLATALNKLAADDRPADPARLDAIAKFATSLCAGIHHHHTVEDLELWPVIVRAAGAEVELSDLTDDHDALDPILDEITAAAGRLRADRAAVPAMAEAMGRLADLLDEHIEEKERRLFPIILKYGTGSSSSPARAATSASTCRGLASTRCPRNWRSCAARAAR
ncbi:hemerythrin domain-containing protein [Nonomuraea sp. NPDC046570]|uniref:hemerythrin domain-containing protein n=1 Tax=Nonomuraea sp. NPDC046570 TaxID=3155255 RepID=UPI0033FD7653